MDRDRRARVTKSLHSCPGPLVQRFSSIYTHECRDFVTSALRSHPPVGKIDFSGNLAYLDFFTGSKLFSVGKIPLDSLVDRDLKNILTQWYICLRSQNSVVENMISQITSASRNHFFTILYLYPTPSKIFYKN